jgi:hypothetical protein
MPMYKRTLGQTRDFMAHVHANNSNPLLGVPYFAFNMFDHETHDEFTIRDGYDSYLKKTLEIFENEGYLNNTMLIFMSDHGHRLSCMRV